MQSVICSFFVRKIKNLASYFPHSIIGKVFFAICNFIKAVLAGSFIGRAIKKNSNYKEILEGSLFCKIILLPVKIAEFIGKKISASYESARNSSKILYIVDNWHLISTRIYGLFLVTFGLMFGVLRFIFGSGTKIILLLSFLIVILGVLLCLINRSIKSLFKGSGVLKAVAGLFFEIEKKEHSPLFLNDDNIHIKGVIPTLAMGAVFGILAFLIGPADFAFAVFGTIFLILVLKYTYLAVFITVAAAPVLPTMALAGLCVLSAGSFLYRMIKDKNFKFIYSPLFIPTIIFAISYLVGTLTSYALVSSIKILMLHIAFMIFYVILYNSLKDEKAYKSILSFFVVMGGFIALYGIIQNILGITGTESWVDENMFQDIKLRVYSTFGNPNVLGEYLVLLIPLSMAFVLRSERPVHKLVYFCIFAIMAVCMILTWSRGAWLGIMLAVMIFLVLTDKRWLLCALLIVVAIPFVPALLNSGSAIIGRFTSIGNMADSSTAYRVSIWRSAIDIIKDYWIGGIGPGSDAFSLIYKNYAASGADFALHSHNLYLQLITELGISGIVVFVMLILRFVKMTAKSYITENRKTLKSSVSIACLAGISGLLLQGLTDYIWYNYKLVLIFWIVLAIGSASVSENTSKGGGGV